MRKMWANAHRCTGRLPPINNDTHMSVIVCPIVDCACFLARQVSTEDAQAYADENGLVYWETSAKTNANVSELFEDIAKRCV